MKNPLMNPEVPPRGEAPRGELKRVWDGFFGTLTDGLPPAAAATKLTPCDQHLS